MIDNIRMFVLDKHRLENHITENKLIDLNTKFNISTGEVDEYPKRGKDLNLEISITNASAVLSGSLHKYHNIVSDLGNQNYNDFNFEHIQSTIKSLIKKYDIDNNTSITNLEFGFNLKVSKDPQIIINKNLIMNNFKDPNKNLKFSGTGDYKEFQLTDYRLKIYNKSKQYKLKLHILRVEFKIIKKRFLQQLGIFTFEDLLEKEVLKKLFEVLRDKINNLIIVDEYYSNNIPEIDYNRLNSYTNPNFWIRVKDEKSISTVYKLKKDFNYLLKKHNLTQTKDEIIEKMDLKFIELLDINSLDLAS